MKTTERVRELVRGTVEGLGYELADVEFAKEYGNWVLTLFIDREGGVSIDDCEAVSRAVDPVLDEADPIEQAYYLSVSSLGLDRPIRKDADFARSLGKRLEVKLYAPRDGKKAFCGELLSYTETAFTLRIGQEEVAFLRKDAALVRPEVTF